MTLSDSTPSILSRQEQMLNKKMPGKKFSKWTRAYLEILVRSVGVFCAYSRKSTLCSKYPGRAPTHFYQQIAQGKFKGSAHAATPLEIYKFTCLFCICLIHGCPGDIFRWIGSDILFYSHNFAAPYLNSGPKPTKS